MTLRKVVSDLPRPSIVRHQEMDEIGSGHHSPWDTRSWLVPMLIVFTSRQSILESRSGR